MIREFQGKHRWLSNFAKVDIRLGNVTFASVEHAYMSMKSIDPAWKCQCAANISPGKIKKLSRTITLRNDWHNIKLRVMEDLCRIKFNQEPFKSKLLSTGNQHIQEGNMWNDKFWGVCLKTGTGENHLGRIIMKIRDKLIS